MAGVDSAGLGEVIQNILTRFPDSEKGRLAKVRKPALSICHAKSFFSGNKNIFVTGSPSCLPCLLPRLELTLRPMLPPEMPINIVRAHDPALDAWKGMADFAKTDEAKTVAVTRQEYEEWGGERVKRWWGGNWR
jgi:actin-related protein 5